MQKPINIHIPISKIDEEQRMVWGIATSEAIDSQGDIIDYEASKAAFGSWLGNIREMHQPIAVGKAIDIQYDDENKQVMIGAKISESADGENAWLKVKEGILQGFSIGGSVNKVLKEVAKKDGVEIPVTRVVDYSLSETSLVDNPANPEAMLVMVKSQKGGLQRTEHMATDAEIKKEFRLPAWHQQFMMPIEKAQALYDNSMKKAGVAVVDGDARDAAAASVAEVKTNTPVKAGTTVPKKVYGADGKSTTNKAEGAEMKKGMYDAAWLLDLAIELSWYIEGEQYEGENVDDLNAALATIKAAVVDELTEPTVELTQSVELAQKLSNLKKGKTMSDTKKGNVVGGVERNANAETIEDNRPPAGEPAAAEANTAADGNNNALSEESDAGNPDAPKPNTTPTAVAEPGDPNAQTRSNEEQIKEDGQPEAALAQDPETGEVKAGAKSDKAPEKAEGDDKGESSDEGAEKAVTLGDLKKFSEGLIAKLGDNSKEELTKALGEFTGKVEKSISSLEGRISKLEDQPAATKGKASFVDVTKGEQDAGEDAELQTVLKRRDELAANPNLGTPEERFEITKQLRKFQAAGHKLELTK